MPMITSHDDAKRLTPSHAPLMLDQAASVQEEAAADGKRHDMKALRRFLPCCSKSGTRAPDQFRETSCQRRCLSAPAKGGALAKGRRWKHRRQAASWRRKAVGAQAKGSSVYTPRGPRGDLIAAAPLLTQGRGGAGGV